ncbi:MAG: SlyX family protein [Lacipirellulaceae bacterium]
MSENDAQARLTKLEERLAFLEQNYYQLNSVVLEQQTELEKLRRELTASREQVQRLSDSLGEDLPHERPPHY